MLDVKRKRDQSVGSVAGSEGVTPWHCEVCDITISVRADGRAREQHLAGSKHAKMMIERVESKLSSPDDASVAAVVASDDAVTAWRCEVCCITINVRADGRAREQHLAGAKHAKLVAAQQEQPLCGSCAQ